MSQGRTQGGLAEHRGDISNPRGSQGQGPSEHMRGPDWSEARRAAARSQIMAERKGFEPSIPFPVYSLSRGAPSTTRPPLQPCGADREKPDANQLLSAARPNFPGFSSHCAGARYAVGARRAFRASLISAVGRDGAIRRRVSPEPALRVKTRFPVLTEAAILVRTRLSYPPKHLKICH